MANMGMIEDTIRKDEQHKCIKDVCRLCKEGKRKLAQNTTGHWYHISDAGVPVADCAAAPIHERVGTRDQVVQL